MSNFSLGDPTLSNISRCLSTEQSGDITCGWAAMSISAFSASPASAVIASIERCQVSFDHICGVPLSPYVENPMQWAPRIRPSHNCRL